jgi:hypothetical protein
MAKGGSGGIAKYSTGRSLAMDSWGSSTQLVDVARCREWSAGQCACLGASAGVAKGRSELLTRVCCYLPLDGAIPVAEIHSAPHIPVAGSGER